MEFFFASVCNGSKITEFYKISEEMPFQILSRLPPKSLMRFKCVHKSWYILISNPSFVDKQLSESRHNKHSTSILCKRFVRNINNHEMEVVCSLITFPEDDDGDDNITHPLVEDIDLPLSMGVITRNEFNEPELPGAVYIVGHCDGIICLVYGDIVLWNPATKEFKILPPSCLPNGIINSIGFGYDVKLKDYEVFSIPSYDEDQISDRVFIYPPRVELYTLGTDSWTEINTEHLETETTIFFPEYFQMYFRGICYWTGSEEQKEFMSVYDKDAEEWVRQLIILFDMNHGVFDHVLFPYSLYKPMIPYLEMQVIVWNECVALFGQYPFGDSDDDFGLWTMDGIAKGSWTKRLTVEVNVGNWTILEFWKSNEIIMIGNDNIIFSYNISNKEIKYLPIESMHPSYTEVIVCVNSIVPVIHGRKQD